MFEKIKSRFQKKANVPDDLHIPTHIAAIMDGNGRWAQKRGLSRSAGHKAGGEVLRKIALACNEVGVKYFTVYAFSTENWKRPEEEVHAIMDLFLDFFDRYREDLRKMDCKILFMGSPDRIPPKVSETIRRAEEESRERQGLRLIIAFNYGGRQEILDAVRKYVADPAKATETLDEEQFRRYLYLPDVPDPDLIIRSSGEMRISNFLMWESAYSEFWVSNVLWPDFTKDDLLEAISDYNKRNRRYGGI